MMLLLVALLVIIALCMYYKYHRSDLLFNQIAIEFLNNERNPVQTLLTYVDQKTFEAFPKYSRQMNRRILLFILTKSTIRQRFILSGIYFHCPFCDMFLFDVCHWSFADDLLHDNCTRRILEIFTAQRYLLLNELCYNRDVTLRIIHLLIKRSIS